MSTILHDPWIWARCNIWGHVFVPIAYISRVGKRGVCVLIAERRTIERIPRKLGRFLSCSQTRSRRHWEAAR